MKKSSRLICSITLALVIFVSISQAETTIITTTVTTTAATLATEPALVVSTPNRSLAMVAGIGGGLYYLSPKDPQIQDYYSNALNWRGFLELKADSGLSVGGDISMYNEANRSSIAPAGTSLTIIPITAYMSYHFFKDSAISPYLGGGIGIYHINESDPDFNYLNTNAFGKHIFVGIDTYIFPDTLLRAELRQAFIDPVNSSLYYQANFSGLTATVALAIEWPLRGPETDMSPEERALAREQRLYEEQLRNYQRHLNEMETYYRQPQWDPSVHRRWKDKQVLQQEIIKTQSQMNDEKAKADQLKREQEIKRQQYLQQKQQKREEKKEEIIQQNPTNPPSNNPYLEQKQQKMEEKKELVQP
ncbi:MAG: hypothetical protein WC863_04675 [Patescibacteria group bacterium]